MDRKLEKYLNTVDKHLKPLPASERADIVREIKSSMIEMEQEELSSDAILERLGDPKELARAYLGDLVTNSRGFGWNRFLAACAFYSAVGFSGIIVLPVLAIIAPVFILCGAVTPILGLVKFGALLFFDYDISLISFQLGPITLPPAAGFIYAVIIGVLLVLLGIGAWKLLVLYVRTVASVHKGQNKKKN